MSISFINNEGEEYVPETKVQLPYESNLQTIEKLRRSNDIALSILSEREKISKVIQDKQNINRMRLDFSARSPERKVATGHRFLKGRNKKVNQSVDFAL